MWHVFTVLHLANCIKWSVLLMLQVKNLSHISRYRSQADQLCQMRQYLFLQVSRDGFVQKLSNLVVPSHILLFNIFFIHSFIHFFVPIVIETTSVLHRTWSLSLCFNRGAEDTLCIPVPSINGTHALGVVSVRMLLIAIR